jgi:hypothetical protein
MREVLNRMDNDQRAETIVDMFRIAASEWGAMVLEHTHLPPGVPPQPYEKGNPIRDRLRELPVEARCEFLGSLFEAICEEFGRLVEDNTKAKN